MDKVDINGLSKLYSLGKIFFSAIRNESDKYMRVFHNGDMRESTYTSIRHYGYHFDIFPIDGRKYPITLSIALWFDDEEVIAIEAVDSKEWAYNLCKKIRNGKNLKSTYAEAPEQRRNGNYYFKASDVFYKDFKNADSFADQVDIVSKYMDEVCDFYC